MEIPLIEINRIFNTACHLNTFHSSVVNWRLLLNTNEKKNYQFADDSSSNEVLLSEKHSESVIILL